MTANKALKMRRALAARFTDKPELAARVVEVRQLEVGQLEVGSLRAPQAGP